MKENNCSDKFGKIIDEQIKQFSIATGVNCFCLSPEKKACFADSGCKFCKTLNGITGNPIECHEALLYGSYQAERFGGKYIFYCPMGLVYFASVLYYEGLVYGALIGGPVLLADKDEYISEDIIEKYKIDAIHAKTIKAQMKGIYRLSPVKVTALSEMLFAVSSHINGAGQLQYVVDEETIGNDMEKYLSFIKTMGADDYSDSYPIGKERELLSLISTGDKERSQKLLEDILKHIIAFSNRDFETAKARILELAVLLSRAALEGGADLEQIFGLNYKYLKLIHSRKTVNELASWLSNIMDRFTDCVFNITNVKHIDIIYKAVDYIKNNYSGRITLEEVACKVHLSPSYFSKIFKEELKISFNAYLNQIRIENSKRLLINTRLDLIKISQMLGFDDQSYFNKVFKKITGTTPGKFRQRHRN